MDEWDMKVMREQVYDLSRRVSDLGERVAKLETWRDNEEANHAAIPTWLFGTITTLVGIASLVANLWLSGVFQ